MIRSKNENEEKTRSTSTKEKNLQDQSIGMGLVHNHPGEKGIEKTGDDNSGTEDSRVIARITTWCDQLDEECRQCIEQGQTKRKAQKKNQILTIAQKIDQILFQIDRLLMFFRWRRRRWRFRSKDKNQQQGRRCSQSSFTDQENEEFCRRPSVTGDDQRWKKRTDGQT